MPTPFTHLKIAKLLQQDTQIPEQYRQLFSDQAPAYLCGSIVADARISPEADRSETHFYRYDRPMDDHPWRVMMQQNPVLMQPKNAGQRAFVAAYVAHLAADEYWSLNVLQPHFAAGEWGENIRDRFFVLHLLLTHMDERDLLLIPEMYPEQIQRVLPENWLPFMPDERICEWTAYVARQIPDDSETLIIFGGRIQTPPEQLRELMDDADYLQKRLWDNIPLAVLDELEAGMYAFAREQLLLYMGETGE